MTVEDFLLWVNVPLWFVAWRIGRDRRRAYKEQLQRAWDYENSARIAGQLRVDGLVQQHKKLKELDEHMIHRLLTQNEQLSRTNVACRCLIDQYTRQCATVQESFLKVEADFNPQYEHCLNSIDLLVRIGNDVSDIKDMVGQMIELLPPVVFMEGVFFEPQIVRNKENDKELVLLYRVSLVDYRSSHIGCWHTWRGWYNPFIGDVPKSFLWMSTGFTSEYGLENAIVDCVIFLKQNNLLPNGTK